MLTKDIIGFEHLGPDYNHRSSLIRVHTVWKKVLYVKIKEKCLIFSKTINKDKMPLFSFEALRPFKMRENLLNDNEINFIDSIIFKIMKKSYLLFWTSNFLPDKYRLTFYLSLDK